jgi:hypothetical protein
LGCPLCAKSGHQFGFAVEGSRTLYAIIGRENDLRATLRNFGLKVGVIDTAAVDSLKALDPSRPIREADIEAAFGYYCWWARVLKFVEHHP